MQNQKLTFAQMQQEFEAIPQLTLRSIKGGVAAVQYEYAIDSNENWYYRIVGDENWISGSNLNAVEITRHQSEPNWGAYITTNPFNNGGSGSSGGYPSSGGGGGSTGGTGSNFWSASALMGYTGMVFEKNAHLLHFTATEASSLADIANANAASRVFVTASRSLGVAGAMFTAYDNATDSNGFTWGDGARVGIGLIATFTPYGWAYALIDLGTGIVTGTTLTDHLGNAIDNYE